MPFKPFILFADDGGFWVGAAGLITALVAGVVLVINTRKESTSQSRKDALSEAFALIDHLKRDREEDRKTIHDMRDRVNELAVKLAVCETQHLDANRRLKLMSAALKRAGIKVDPDLEVEG